MTKCKRHPLNRVIDPSVIGLGMHRAGRGAEPEKSNIGRKPIPPISNVKAPNSPSNSVSNLMRKHTLHHSTVYETPKRPLRLITSTDEAGSIDAGCIEPRPLLRLKPSKVAPPRNGKRLRIAVRNEVLKPLESADDDGFEPAEELAVIGVAITKFDDGWDLPPGLSKEAIEMECTSDWDPGAAEDRVSTNVGEMPRTLERNGMAFDDPHWALPAISVH
jgi:hypothetical protein